jgi:hypothetical protein
MAFDLSNYSTVAERIELFVLEHSNFRIDSQVWDIVIDGSAYVRVKVSIYKDAYEEFAWSVGWAQEKASKPFALESCETSAYGRALANANYAAKLGTPRASVEEMQSIPSADTWDIPSYTTAAQAEQAGIPSLGSSQDGSADRIPECRHGVMVWTEGVGKNTGKPWGAWRCLVTNKAEQCQPAWYVLSSNGKWKPQV